MHILEEGQKFERYHIIRHLGQGISGICYEAEDSRLKNTVVLKLIQPWSEVSYATRRQFFRNMQVLSVLIHPYLTTVLNYGEVAGQLYVVRHYISGGSLLGNAGRKWLNPPLPIKDAFTYTYQLSQALHLIHSYDNAHGALTFSNILISKQPLAEADSAPLRLSDAGLAQFIRRFGQPQQHMLPMTAAPEQFKGQVTPASDQYALAILLYVWLTGRPPFAGPPAEIEQLKLAGNIPMPDRLLTGEQERIIRRALNPKQDARYPSILTFAKALVNSLQPVQQTTEFAKNEENRTNGALKHQQATTISNPIIVTGEPERLASTELRPQLTSDMAQSKQVRHLEQNNKTPVLATPTPDITQVISEQVPLQTRPESIQSQATPKREAESSIQEAENQNIKPQAYAAAVEPTSTAYLTITSPFSQELRKIPLLKDEVTLGRAGSSDILLDEDTITSRHHAHVKREEKHYVIYDKRSSYGVTVNDQKLEEGIGYKLQEGDHIQIGDYTLLFSLHISQNTDNTHIEHNLQ
jgi:serine/threonine protein kinase